MKEIFANSTVGIAGLLFFLVVFAGMLLWVLRPSAKGKYKQYGDIPLKDDSDE